MIDYGPTLSHHLSSISPSLAKRNLSEKWSACIFDEETPSPFVYINRVADQWACSVLRSLVSRNSTALTNQRRDYPDCGASHRPAWKQAACFQTADYGDGSVKVQDVGVSAGKLVHRNITREEKRQRLSQPVNLELDRSCLSDSCILLSTLWRTVVCVWLSIS